MTDSSHQIRQKVNLTTVTMAVWVVLWGLVTLGVQPLWAKLAAAFVTTMVPAMAWYFK